MSHKLLIFIFISTGIYFALICCVAKAGIRGSDQYWYVADTDNLIKGLGIQSNWHYPVRLLKGDTDAPFVHNVPQVYMAALIGFLFGAYYGWIIMNVLLNICSAFLIYLMLRKELSIHPSILGSVFFLLCPISFWLSSQPLAEPFLTLVLTLTLYIYLNYHPFKNVRLRYLFLSLLSILLSVSRPVYIPLLFMMPVIYFIENRGKRYVVFKSVGLLFVSTFLLMAIKYFIPDNIDLFSIIKGGLFNTAGYHAPGSGIQSDILSVNDIINRIIIKTVDAFKIQFTDFDSRTVLFYLPFNLMVLLILVLLKFSDFVEKKRMLLIMSFLFLLHIATVIIYQNQPRYLVPYYPFTIVLFFIQLNSFLKRISFNYSSLLMSITQISIIVFIVINLFITKNAINDSLSEKTYRETTGKIFNSIIPQSDNVMIVDRTPYGTQKTDYILRPRKVLILDETHSADQLYYMKKMLDIRWLICSQSSAMPEKLRKSRLINYGQFTQDKIIFNIFRIDSD